jgi:hypothetical protein
MRFACALADCADLSENGAIPPGVWQPAHFSAKTGATADQVGEAALAAGRVAREPVAIVETTTATAIAVPSANPILFRCTQQSYALVKRS